MKKLLGQISCLFLWVHSTTRLRTVVSWWRQHLETKAKRKRYSHSDVSGTGLWRCRCCGTNVNSTRMRQFNSFHLVNIAFSSRASFSLAFTPPPTHCRDFHHSPKFSCPQSLSRLFVFNKNWLSLFELQTRDLVGIRETAAVHGIENCKRTQQTYMEMYLSLGIFRLCVSWFQLKNNSFAWNRNWNLYWIFSQFRKWWSLRCILSALSSVHSKFLF